MDPELLPPGPMGLNFPTSPHTTMCSDFSEAWKDRRRYGDCRPNITISLFVCLGMVSSCVDRDKEETNWGGGGLARD